MSFAGNPWVPVEMAPQEMELLKCRFRISDRQSLERLWVERGDESQRVDYEDFTKICKRVVHRITANEINQVFDEVVAAGDSEDMELVALKTFRVWLNESKAAVGLSAKIAEHGVAAKKASFDKSTKVHHHKFLLQDHLGELEVLRTKMKSAATSWRGLDDVDRMFARFDRDRSGAIDYNELHIMVKRLMPEASDLDIDLIEQVLDPDGDGEVTLEEVRGFIMSPRKKRVTRRETRSPQEIRKKQLQKDLHKERRDSRALQSREEFDHSPPGRDGWGRGERMQRPPAIVTITTTEGERERHAAPAVTDLDKMLSALPLAKRLLATHGGSSDGDGDSSGDDDTIGSVDSSRARAIRSAVREAVEGANCDRLCEMLHESIEESMRSARENQHLRAQLLEASPVSAMTPAAEDHRETKTRCEELEAVNARLLVERDAALSYALKLEKDLGIAT